jgi:hypothetical protein
VWGLISFQCADILTDTKVAPTTENYPQKYLLDIAAFLFSSFSK